MRAFFRNYTLLVVLLAALFTARAADKPVFEVSTPLTVALGEAFRVEFSLNAKPDDNSFKAPAFEGFEVLAGPAVSSGSSIQIINGSMTKSVNVSYTFVLLPKVAGAQTIGSASASVDGEQVSSRPQPIEVVDEGSAGGSSGRSTTTQQQQRGGQEQDISSRVAEDDVLLRAVVSRSTLYKNEPLYVTYKLYSRVRFTDYSFDANPSFNGFWAQELNNKQRNAQMNRETYNGKVYDTYVLGEWLLYPQQAGELTLDPMGMTIVAQVLVPSRHRDPFFGQSHEVYNVPRKVQSAPLKITVKQLPQGAPADFSGAVGSFTLETTPPASHLAANSGATYTVRIAGTGNLTFVQAPKLNLPTSFELYNTKTTESINASPSGITGYRQFEYPFIARADGNYTLEPVTFSYFDPQRMQYMTLSSKELTLEVTPDKSGSSAGAMVLPGRGVTKEEVRLLGEDIRFIKLGSAQLTARTEPLIGTWIYWLVVVLILAETAMAYKLLRRRISESQNLVLVRGKRANKMAVQRFRAARKYMELRDRRAFYEEMLRALWGYMSDKLNIPVALLTKERVREELLRRRIATEVTDRFTQIITRCDEAQYSPSTSAEMSEIYAEGVELVSEIESKIKR